MNFEKPAYAVTDSEGRFHGLYESEVSARLVAAFVTGSVTPCYGIEGTIRDKYRTGIEAWLEEDRKKQARNHAELFGSESKKHEGSVDPAP